MTSSARNKYRRSTVAAVVIANMIGTGVFTSLGFQLLEIQSGFVLLALWAVGGLIALCGAMSYAELGAALPRSGGEYNFLSRIYHPAAGFVSGWVSATIGFAAPSALAAMTFAAYLASSTSWQIGDNAEKAMAVALVIVLTAAHSISRRHSGGLQGFFTILKVATIVAFSGAALVFVDNWQPISVLPVEGDAALLSSGAFAVSLIYVSYAYTGWNAATYLSSELANPQKDLPVILFAGTAVVTTLYLMLNYVFLKVAPASAMAGQVEVGFIAASHAFGESGGKLAGIVLSLLLISTVSAMTLAGPRVLQVIGEDFRALEILSRCNRDGLPYIAILLQSCLTVVFIVTSSFESILVFAGFTLALNSFVTVLGIFVLRWREPELARPYRTFGYPFTPLVYLLLTLWTLTFVLLNKPAEGWFGLAVVVAGIFVYGLASRRNLE
ncbi:MAG: amino acid permease [Woeseiaceae bacterium]|nr:amino acid permease [Woeseiaceae bacterium]